MRPPGGRGGGIDVDRDRRGRKGGVDFAPLEQLVVFEHAEDAMEELAHGGDQGLQLGFAARQQVFIESAHR